MKLRNGECPYCGAKLRKEDCCYLMHWSDRQNLETLQVTYPGLYEFLNQDDILGKQESCSNRRKSIVWESSSNLKFNREDIFLSFTDAGAFVQYLERRKAKKKESEEPAAGSSDSPRKQTARPHFQTIGSVISSPLASMGYSNAEIIQDPAEYCYQRENWEDFGYDGQISVGAIEIASLRSLCPTCLNIIPHQFFNESFIKVYLMAPQSCGKTSMLYSIYDNMDTFNKKNKKHMAIEAIQESNVDPYFKYFTEQAMEFQRPDAKINATETHYVPPVFFRVTITLEEEQKSLIAAFYDCSGELFRGEKRKRLSGTANGEGRPLETEIEEEGIHYRQRYNNAMRLNDMDAIWCLINSEFSAMYDDKGLLSLNPDQKDKIRRTAKIMDRREGRQEEESILAEDFTFDDIFKYYLDLDNGDVQEQTVGIMKELQNTLGGSDRMNRAIRNMYLAMIISKCDYLQHSSMLPANYKDAFFDSDEKFNPDYSDESEAEAKEIRQRVIKGWQGKEVLVDFDLTRFEKTSYHCVAAKIPRRVSRSHSFQPIRIEEPLFYMVRHFLGN